jgi:putative endonuclease
MSMRDYYVYMVLCADGSYYVGITNSVERRLWEHNAGISESSYTFTRRPVSLAHCSSFGNVDDAIRWEKQLKGWSRAKKRALVDDDWEKVHQIVRDERFRRG